MDDETRNFAVLLYDVAALTSGYEIEDSGDFASRIMAIMTSKVSSSSSGGIVDAEVEKDDVAVLTATEEDIVSAENEDADVNPTTATISSGVVDVEVESATIDEVQ